MKNIIRNWRPHFTLRWFTFDPFLFVPEYEWMINLRVSENRVHYFWWAKWELQVWLGEEDK